jgi:hypothetical protein
MNPREPNGVVQPDDCLAGPGRSGAARRPVVVALDNSALRRMQKDSPLLPGIIERALQFLDVGQHAETPLRVRMREGGGKALA